MSNKWNTSLLNEILQTVMEYVVAGKKKNGYHQKEILGGMMLVKRTFIGQIYTSLYHLI
jgi:hypothetical protein